MANLSKLLEIPLEQLQATEMTGMPDRGRTLGDLPPKEPLIYRLFEIVQNYGYAYKAVLNEKFGDGIMVSPPCPYSRGRAGGAEGLVPVQLSRMADGAVVECDHVLDPCGEGDG